MKKMNKKGFTIVELVIVIAVIAILAAVLIPTFSNVVDKAQNSAALQEVKNAYTATIAEEMATADAADDKISGKAISVEAGNGKVIEITAKGEVKIPTGTTSPRYVAKDGLIVCKESLHTWKNNGTTCTCANCGANHRWEAEGEETTCKICNETKTPSSN